MSTSIDYSTLAQNLRLVLSRKPDAAEYFCALLIRQCPPAQRVNTPDVSTVELAKALERALPAEAPVAALSHMFRGLGALHRGQPACGEMIRAGADALGSILILVSADAWTQALHSLWRVACSQFIQWITEGLGLTAPNHSPALQLPHGPEEPSTSEAPFLLVLAGPSQGEVIPLSRTLTIGSGDNVDLHIPDLTVFLLLARIVRGNLASHLTDLQSTAGTSLNGLPVSRPTVLADGDRIALGSTTLMVFTHQEGFDEHFRSGLFQRATHDPLTQVYTRVYFDARLVSEIAFARRHEMPISLLLLQPRPAVVEEASPIRRCVSLRRLARRMKSALRVEDLLARYSDEWLAILCRNLDAQRALTLAHRLRHLFSAPLHVVGTNLRY